MPRPRFSEMLVTRRRQLGLSISQASQVLRLKEQVLIAFEEGDFDHIPKSGYAQGMLSSYARYLGLNPRQVVNQFQADLNDYVKDMQSAMPEDYESQDTYLAPRKLLPTSGGPESARHAALRGVAARRAGSRLWLRRRPALRGTDAGRFCGGSRSGDGLHHPAYAYRVESHASAYVRKGVERP